MPRPKHRHAKEGLRPLGRATVIENMTTRGEAESQDLASLRPFGATLREAWPRICGAIAGGSTLNHACDLAGFARQSLYTARQKDPELDAQIRRAEAIRDENPKNKAYEAACEEPEYAYKWMAIHRKDEWAPVAKQEVTLPQFGDGLRAALEAARKRRLGDVAPVDTDGEEVE